MSVIFQYHKLKGIFKSEFSLTVLLMDALEYGKQVKFPLCQFLYDVITLPFATHMIYMHISVKYITRWLAENWRILCSYFKNKYSHSLKQLIQYIILKIRIFFLEKILQSCKKIHKIPMHGLPKNSKYLFLKFAFYFLINFWNVTRIRRKNILLMKI